MIAPPIEFLDGRVILRPGDCLEVIRLIPDSSIDAIVTDPPYALVSIAKRFGSEAAAPAQHGIDGAFARASRGFMGKEWDTGEVAFAVEFWRQCFRVLKPGGYVVAFSGTRTYHRLACAIEDAGFEIRDQLAWAYGTGFPKAADVSKQIDKRLGAEREKVRHKPRPESSGTMAGSSDSRPWIEKSREAGFHEVDGDTPVTPEAMEWEGWKTALKPAWEPIVMARKPCMVPDDGGRLRPATVAENIMHWGTGALNIGACRIDAEKPTGWGGAAGGSRERVCTPGNKEGDARPVQGRFPANIVHDGSQEVLDAFPETSTGGAPTAGDRNGDVFGKFAERSLTSHGVSEGSAARFFYSAKADKDDRLRSEHPTVKPVDLMQWLIRLVCRKGGTVLDPFAGTGTTGQAAFWEDTKAVLIEREPEYQADIAFRMKLALSGPDERKRARTTPAPLDAEGTPLFAALTVDETQTPDAAE